MRSWKSLLYIWCVCISLAGVAFASRAFPVFRAIQYARKQDLASPEKLSHYGVQRVNVNHDGLALSQVDLHSNSSLFRRIVVASVGELSGSVVSSLVIDRGGALLVLIPEERIIGPKLEQWLEIENILINNEILGPVYFARTSEVPSEVVASPSEFRFVLRIPDPRIVKSLPIVNFQGWIAGERGGIDEHGHSLPTIAVIAHSDTFSASPALSTGCDCNGSGVVALLELSRLFSRLREMPRSQPRYNLVFVLTGGGSLNFAGAGLWAQHNATDTLQFGLCLDTIGREGPLFVHHSKPSGRDPALDHLLEAFNQTAALFGREFFSKHKKVDLTADELSWEHEKLALQHILGLTVSNRYQARPLFSQSSVFDTAEMVSEAVLVENIRFVAEALARYIYALEDNALLFEGYLAPDPHFVRSFVQLLSSFPHSPVERLPKALYEVFEQVLFARLSDVSIGNWDASSSSDVLFYTDSSSSLAAYRVRSALTDIWLLCLIVLYLLLLFVIIKGPKEAIVSLRLLIFRPTSQRKLKRT